MPEAKTDDFYLEAVGDDEPVRSVQSPAPNPGIGSAKGVDDYYLEPAGEEVEDTGRNPMESFGRGTARGGLETGAAIAGAASGFTLGLAGGPAAPLTAPLGGALGYKIGEWIGSSTADDFIGEEDEDDLGAPTYHGGRVFGETLAASVALPSLARNAVGRLPNNWAGRFLSGMVDEAARGLVVAKKLPESVARFLSGSVFGRSAAITSTWVPSRYGIHETLAGAGAAVGATIAEKIDPGDAISRITGEVVGGAALPKANLLYLGTKLMGSLGKFVGKQLPSGRRSAAGEVLRDYVNSAGEDPEKLLKMLKDGRAASEAIAGGENLHGTASVLLDSPSLMQLEADLGRNSPTFVAAISKQHRDALQAQGRAISLLRSDGSPEALEAAVRIRHDMMETMVSGYVEKAQLRALESAKKIGGADLVDEFGRIKPGKMQDISKAASDEIGAHFIRLRETEEHMWGEAFKGMENFTAKRKFMNISFNDIRANRVASDIFLPPNLKNLMGEIRAAEDVLRSAQDPLKSVDAGQIQTAMKTLSVKKLMLTRTQLLGEVRVAVQRGDMNSAEMIGRMVDAVTKDLFHTGTSTRMETLSLPGGGERSVRRSSKGSFSRATAFDQALAFTKAFKDVAARSFVGTTRKKDMDGALDIQPEVMMHKALSSGKALGDIRMREIRTFMQFSPEQMGLAADAGDIGAAEGLMTVVKAQTNVLRTTAFEAIDPMTGKASAARLKTFLQRHNDMLDDFPEIREDINSALKDTESLKHFVQRAKNYRRARDKRFVQGLGYNTVTGALAASFGGGRNMKQNLDTLVSTAKRSGDGAMESLRYSIWDTFFAKARGPAGTYNVVDFKATLNETIPGTRTTIREYMVQNDLLKPDVAKRLDQALNYTDNIINSQQLKAGDEPIKQAGLVENLLVSVMGAEGAKRGFQAFQRFTGGPGTKVASGPTLVLAQRGSHGMREWLVQTPSSKMKTVLQDALAGASLKAGGEPYSLLEKLLEKPGSPSSVMSQIRAVNIYMWNAGLHAIQELDDYDEDDTISP